MYSVNFIVKLKKGYLGFSVNMSIFLIYRITTSFGTYIEISKVRFMGKVVKFSFRLMYCFETFITES